VIFDSNIVRPSYGPLIDAKLDTSEKLFRKFDRNKDGKLERDEISSLISATYEIIGINDFKPMDEDVDSFLLMAGKNPQGEITYPDFEAIVLEGLRTAGFEV